MLHCRDEGRVKGRQAQVEVSYGLRDIFRTVHREDQRQEASRLDRLNPRIPSQLELLKEIVGYSSRDGS